MKMRQLVLLTLSAALLACTAGCELLVDFDRNKIDPAMMTPDACVTDCEDAGPDGGEDAGDAGPDASDDGGTMDAMVIGDAGNDAEVMVDSGGMMDAAMDGSDDEDSGL